MNSGLPFHKPYERWTEDERESADLDVELSDTIVECVNAMRKRKHTETAETVMKLYRLSSEIPVDKYRQQTIKKVYQKAGEVLLRATQQLHNFGCIEHAEECLKALVVIANETKPEVELYIEG